MAGSERRRRELGRDAARGRTHLSWRQARSAAPARPPARAGKAGEAEAAAAEARGGGGEPAGPCAGGGGRVRSRGDGGEPGTSAELRAHGGPRSECARTAAAPARWAGPGRRPRETGGDGGQSGARGPRDVTLQGPDRRGRAGGRAWEAAVTPPLAAAALCLLPVAMATQAARQPPGWGRAWFPPCQHRLAWNLSHPPASALPLGLQAWAGPCLGP